MRIIINEKEKNFVFEMDGYEQVVTFKEITDSLDWKEKGIINIKHSEKNVYGFFNNTCLTRGQFLEMMKNGREHYYRSKGVWDYNTGVHKLYAILDGKSLAEAEAEIENLSKQHEAIWRATLEWNNERVKRYYQEECNLEALKCIAYPGKDVMDKMKIQKRKMKQIDNEQPPFELPKEMQRLYDAALDESLPHIKLSNVSPDLVKQEYGEDFKVL